MNSEFSMINIANELEKENMYGDAFEVYYNYTCMYPELSQNIIYNQRKIISKLNCSIKKNNKAIYTCVTDKYDLMLENDYFFNEEWDYYLFTDDEELLMKKTINKWIIKPIYIKCIDKVRKARWVKLHPYILLHNYDYCLWMDANIVIKDRYIFIDIDEKIKQGSLISSSKHPYRDCIYEELEACSRMRKDDIRLMNMQIDILKKDSYPVHNGLFETNILLINNSNKKVIKLLEDWWQWIFNYSRRDQLSFTYVLWKNNIVCHFINDVSLRFHRSVYLKEHNQIHMKKKKSLMVHFHLYYLDQLDFFIDKLKNITMPYDLYITMCKYDINSIKKIYKEKKDAKIIYIPNRGYDVGPFVYILSLIDIDEYDFILKIHTKSNRKSKFCINGKEYENYGWRDELVSQLIGSKDIFMNNMKTLQSNDKIGMIGSKNLMRNSYNNKNNFLMRNKLLESFGFKIEDTEFVAGTMFIIRSPILKLIKDKKFKIFDFNESAKTGDVGTLAHGMEAIFSAIVKNSGYEIKGVDYNQKNTNNTQRYNYRTYNAMIDSIKKNISAIPFDFDLVVGIPRSGIIPAYILGTLMSKPTKTLDEFVNKVDTLKGDRFVNMNNLTCKNVLIIDDSVNKGRSLDRVKSLVNSINENYTIKYAAVYATDDSKHFVDFYFEICNQPRFFEWNYLNHPFCKNWCYDIDGVLCIDPTDEENDDGERYIEFLKNAKPLYIPNYKIKALATSRLEKYRELTELWLKKHNVRYENLYMLDLPSKKERIMLKAHTKIKIETYLKDSSLTLFLESDPVQAKMINMATKKPVICTKTGELFW